MKWFNKLQIKFRCGDIFESKAEGLMISATTSLEAYGNLSTKFFNKYSQKISPQIASILDGRTNKILQLGEAVTLTLDETSGIPKKIILATLWQEDNLYTPNLIW